MTAITLVLTIVLRLCLMRENNRRRNLLPEEYQREAAVDESCDRVSQYSTVFYYLYDCFVFILC